MNAKQQESKKFSKLFDTSDLDSYYLLESTLNDPKAFENSKLKLLFEDELNTIVLNCSNLSDDETRKVRSGSLSNK